MVDVMNLFGEYTLYVYIGAAILYFYKIDGVPLYKKLFGDSDDNEKKIQQVAEPLSAPLQSEISQLEPHRLDLPNNDKVKAVGITLINQDLANLSIQNQKGEKVLVQKPQEDESKEK